MLKKFITLAALAGMALLAMPATSEAQVRIGVGRGGYGNGYGNGYGRGYGGYGYGNYGRGYGNYYGQPGISIGIGSGYYGSNYGRGYYPGYYGNNYVYTQPVAPSYQSFYPSTDTSFAPATVAVPATGGTASITVRVPFNAQVWWNGSASTVNGETRFFRTAPLPPDGAMQTFQAQWMGANGQQVTQTREVRAMPNGSFTVDFNQPTSN